MIAVTDNGEILSWGFEEYGCLGQGPGLTAVATPTYVKVWFIWTIFLFISIFFPFI
jgi:alpha-tubulin suppressor-like RCC1 family protein